MKKSLPTSIFAFIVTWLLWGPAFAADPMELLPTAPMFQTEDPQPLWSGPYLGATLRYGNEETQADGTANLIFDLNGDGFAFQSTSETVYTSHNGLVGGVFAGYNHQFESDWVLGFEIGMERTEWNSWLGTASPRLGYAKGRALLFAEGGYAFQRTDLESAEPSTFGGYHFGAGVDLALTDRVFLGLKYNQFHFFGADVNLPASLFNDTGWQYPLTESSSAIFNFEKYTLQTLSVRFGRKF
ncbi:MAG: outer membrane beta-barrel protein [Pseudomonadota bacterium]